MSRPVPYDALFVINQNCDLAQLCQLCHDKGHQRIFILTTHSLFANERKCLQDNALQEISTQTFAHYLTDEDMAECDDQSTRSLLPAYPEGASRGDYNGKFMVLSVARKNRLVRDRLFEQERFAVVYCAEGLGIDVGTWLVAGASNLEPTAFRPPARRRWPGRLLDKLGNLFKNRELRLAREDATTFLFLSPVKRLRFVTGPDRLVYRPLRELMRQPFPGLWLRRVEHFIAEQEARLGRELLLATTIHAYAEWMSRLRRPLYIFVDGYHPGNYPRTYFDSYIAEAFVPRTMLDVRWFEQSGAKIRKPPAFLERETFSEINRVMPVTTVVLLLNHAGDWTALINRSDTDLLIDAFVDAARSLPQVNFVIRPHPTMVDPSHEGQNAIVRIDEYVHWCGLGNLEMSKGSLEDDFRRGDLFVSEYSQTLLDIYRLGKAGLIANVTGRRSFMADYEELGFPRIAGGESLAIALSWVVADPHAHVATQNAAVRRYNSLLHRYLDQGGEA